MASAETSLFRNRTYRHLFAAQVIALAGTGLSTVALSLLAYDLSGGDAGAVLGTALAIKMVAYVGIAPIVGGIASFLPRRGLLIGLDLGRALCVVGLPFVTEVWQIYVLVFLLNACSAAFTPTFQATIPDILPDEDQYTRALSYSRLAYDLENLLSPLAAAGALLFLSYDFLFAANALAFLVSALLVWSISLPSPRPMEREAGLWENLSFGTRAYLKTPRLRGLLALSLAVSCAGAMAIVNTVVYIRDDLGGTDSETALAFAAMGAGSMLIALSLPRFLQGRSDRAFMMSGSAVLSAGLLLGVTGPGMAAFFVLWFFLGIGSSLVQTPSGRLLKRSAHEGDRPAIYAAHFALSHACWLVGYLLAGWAGQFWGLEVAFLLLGFLACGASLLALTLWPRDDVSEVEHHHPETEHEHLHVHDAHHQHSHEGWEGAAPHRHPHRHGPVTHRHTYVIDLHHPLWPRG